MTLNTLYARAKDGDSAAAESLFAHLSDRIRYFVNRKVGNKADAEEIVQDALTTIAGEYRQIEIERSFAAWVFKVVDNKILGYLAKKKREKDRVVDLAQEDQWPDPRSTDPAFKLRLLDCLKKLGEVRIPHARVIVLHAQGYKTPEICERMKLTRNAFYVLLSRSRAMLAECLDRGGPTR